MSPDAIRSLRGAESRATFAKRLGVTPFTVYRWELAPTAKEYRSPRGKVLESLHLLARSATLAPLAPPRASLPATPPTDADAAVDRALHLASTGRLARAEEELLGLLASGRLVSSAARARASVGIAEARLLGRLDVRMAMTALVPVLADADADIETAQLPEAVAARAFALAAIVYAVPDPRLFDSAKSKAYAARALAIGGDDDFVALARVGELASVLIHGDPTGIAAWRDGVASDLDRATSPVIRCVATDLQATAAYLTGDLAGARRFAELARVAADAIGFAPTRARIFVAEAERTLIEAGAPAMTLELTRRAREAIEVGQLAASDLRVRIVGAEVDAYVRLGRFDEAVARLREGHALAEQAGVLSYLLAQPASRLCLYTGDVEGMKDLAARLTRMAGESSLPLPRVHATYVRGILAWMEGDHAGAAALADQAASEATSIAVADFVLRDACLLAFGARVLGDDVAGAQMALRRAERLLDRLPSAWHTALLRRFKGVSALDGGRTQEGLQHLEAATAAFTLSGDVVQAAIDRALVAHGTRASHLPDGDLLVASSDAELARLGIRVFERLRWDKMLDEAHGPALDAPAADVPVQRLVVPIERLSLRGVGASLLQRELLQVIQILVPGRAVHLDELDSTGNARRITFVGEEEPTASERFELTDGCGRRLRVSVAGRLSLDQRAAVRALVTVAGLSLEVASLRGFANPASTSDAQPQGGVELPGFVGVSASMRRLRDEIVRLAASRATVLITGESGSGKEVVARAIHDVSTRAKSPYVPFNCAAVPRDLFEGQLFGYRRGAFTGAASDHPGVVRAAEGGTLFLDEIGELPLDVQPKLLRFLENGEVLPLGERKPVRVSVRVIAATHRDLARLIRDGRFREDLYYRLDVVPLHVPPLRERPEDIAPLARLFVERLTPEGGEPPALGPDALAALMAHAWPGNVRELRNVLERALAFAPLPRALSFEHLRIGETRG